MNLVALIGNLADEPKLEYTQSGVARCGFRIAVQREYADANGQRGADFFNVTVWRAGAENCAKYLHKGSKCAVHGSLQSRSYEGQDGVKRVAVSVIAERVQFLYNAPQGGAGMPVPPPTVDPATGFSQVQDDDELPF